MKHAAYTTLKEVTKELRGIYADFPLPLLLVFLEVGQNKGGLTVSQIMQRTGLSQSSASRHCRALTAWQEPKKAGRDLAIWVADPTDFRSKLLVLNDKGRALSKSIGDIMS